jgi:hypothetical protein
MQKGRASTVFNLGFNIRAGMGVASSVAKRALNWRLFELLKCTDISK